MSPDQTNKIKNYLKFYFTFIIIVLIFLDKAKCLSFTLNLRQLFDPRRVLKGSLHQTVFIYFENLSIFS
jgi:hypothetical protein